MMRAGGTAACLGLLLACDAAAQLPSPLVEAVHPGSAQAGTEIEVVVTGRDLDEAATMLGTTDGITAARTGDGKFKLTVAADCPRGVHELRVVGKFGVSQARPFVVGDAPVTADPGGNFTRATATAVPFPCVVSGVFDAAQRDHFKTRLGKGTRVKAACVSLALDSPADPVLTVLAPDGKTAARADDERDRDAEAEFEAAMDGEYWFVVNDKLFAGGLPRTYRLEIGAALTPLADGSPADLRQPPGVEMNTVTSPAGAQPLRVEPPVKVEGCRHGASVEFTAEKGRALWIEASSKGDPLLALAKITRDEKGTEQRKVVLDLDDTPDTPGARFGDGSYDPAGRFVADETALFRIVLRDRFHPAKPGPVTLTIRDATEGFELLAMPESPANEGRKFFTWQPALRRGGTVAFTVGASRRGYDGDIKLRCEGLPDGVSAEGVIPAGAAAGRLVIAAKPDAARWSGFIKITGEGGGQMREAAAVAYRWSVGDTNNERLDTRTCRPALAVIEEPAPLVLSTHTDMPLEARIGGALEIPVKLTRGGPLSQPRGEWLVSLDGLPGLKKAEPLKLDGAAAKDAKLALRLENKDGNAFAPGEYAVRLRATGRVAYKRDEKAKEQELKHEEFSEAFTVRITPPPPKETK